MKRRLLLSMAWAALILAGPANAQLKLSDFFIDLNPATQSEDLYAENLGQERLFLKVSVVEVQDPGQETEEIVDIADPRELGLLVSPQRLVVEPGGEKRIRVLALAPTDRDRFFKVTVTPVVGDVESEQTIGVKLMIAYAAWVFLRPEGAVPHLTGVREGRVLRVRNSGGTHAELTGGRQCASDSMGSCEGIERFRVLAGQEKEIELPYPDNEAPIDFKVLYAGQADKVAF